MTRRHVLILGGTGEARALAQALAAFDGLTVTSSLAGRTQAPLMPAGNVRIGGFGGAEGLEQWLRVHDVACLVDATHPFAARIGANASAAAQATSIPLLRLARPEWRAQAGDRWIDADDLDHAVRLLGEEPRRVFLAVGRQGVAPFMQAPQHHYFVRSVEPVSDLPPEATAILDRGPFDVESEMRLLRDHAIDMLVTKNSGGTATHAKIEAARSLGLPVVMVRRPERPQAQTVPGVAEAVDALAHALALPQERGE